MLLLHALGHVRDVAPELQAGEAVERVKGLRERVANDVARQPRRDDERVPARVSGVRLYRGRKVEVHRVLGCAEHPVEAVRLVDVGGEGLGLADPTVDGEGEQQRVVAEDIGQRDRGPAVDTGAEVVPRVADRGSRHIVRAEPRAVVLQRELARVRQRGRRVKQVLHRDRRQRGA